MVIVKVISPFGVMGEKHDQRGIEKQKVLQVTAKRKKKRLMKYLKYLKKH